MIDQALLNRAGASLRTRATAIEAVQFVAAEPRTFSFADICTGVQLAELAAWLTHDLQEHIGAPAIYRLAVDSAQGAAALRDAFVAYSPEPGVALTRNNHIADSTTLYVGSSQSIATRLAQHLNDTYLGTYALKMNRWCPDAAHRIHVEVAVAISAMDGSQIQDIEDALWTSSRPMFGRQGSR